MTNGGMCHNEAWYIIAEWYADTQRIHNMLSFFLFAATAEEIILID